MWQQRQKLEWSSRKPRNVKNWWKLGRGFSIHGIFQARVLEWVVVSFWAPKNWWFQTVVLKTESLLDSKEIKPVNPKGNPPWIFIGRTDAEAPILLPPNATHWKRPWYWERLSAWAEGDNRGWDGWMASPTQWTWVRVNSRSWWWTGRPGVLQSLGSQRVGHDWVTELSWTEVVTK